MVESAGGIEGAGGGCVGFEEVEDSASQADFSASRLGSLLK
jgi:hypothetical protein